MLAKTIPSFMKFIADQYCHPTFVIIIILLGCYNFTRSYMMKLIPKGNLPAPENYLQLWKKKKKKSR